MDINIRPAGLLDVQAIDTFQHGIGIHERPLDRNIKRAGKIRYHTLADIKNFIKSRSSTILIAELNGKPVGCGLAEIKENRASWSKYKNKGFIGMMFVEKEYRGRSVGKRILEELLKWFQRRKVRDIRLQVYQNNIPSVGFYKKCGFEDYILEMIYRPD